MRKEVVILLTLAVTGCSTGLKPPPTVDGNHRQAINTPQTEQSIQQKVRNRRYRQVQHQRQAAKLREKPKGPTLPRSVTVHFSYNSTAFNPPRFERNMLADFIQSGDRLQVLGRTDASHAYPGDLSVALGRAEAAKSYLVTHGASAQRITVSYISGDDYIANNHTRAGRAQNRRVVIQRLPQ